MGRVRGRRWHTWAVERAFSAPTVAPQDRLYAVMADLATYPNWLDLVHRAEPAPTASSQGDGDQAPPAWTVTLRARIGPLARSKRLRMVRTVDDGRLVRFERRELDGRQHSDWTLSAWVDHLEDEPWRSEVRLDLTYGGSLWSGLLEGVLEAAAGDATERLQAYVAERG